MSEESHRQAVALYNLACELQQRQDFEAAVATYEKVLALDPKFAAAYSNQGAALTALNRCDEALASLDRAIDLRADYAEAHFCKAVALLMLGDLPAGFTEFEWRWQTVPGRALRQTKNFLKPQWHGEEGVAGKTLLLYSERGFGDTLHFCRYALLVAQLQATVILQVQAPLVALLRSLSNRIQVISEAETLPHFEYHCPLLSLPWVFKTSVATIPAARRYLRADPAGVERFRARLATPGTRRVGLVWHGDAHNPDDRNRSIELRSLLSFLPPGLQYFSLQKEVTPAEQDLIQAHPLCAFLDGASEFEDTAALCECLDLVVAVDTSVAHLAAALGMKTWILLPFNPDCRWLLDRLDSPWYPTVELYRQTRVGDWSAVLARLRDELGRLPQRF